MTTSRIQQCAHCRDEYEFFTSMYGASFPPHNHGSWCRTCARVVSEAFGTVPKKYEWVDVPVTNVTLGDCLRWEAERRARMEGQVYATKVSAPLFNLDTGGTDRSGFVFGPDMIEYHYRYWPGKEAEAVITRRMEENLETGELRGRQL